MGPYCQFCDQRCFVHDPTKAGQLLATCQRGQEHDKSEVGYCWGEVKVSDLAVECVQLKEKLMRAGLYRTGQKMESVVTEIGWELADKATAPAST